MAKAQGSKHNRGEITALQVQRFKGPGKLRIGNGLYLVVTATGNRRWVYRFTFAGKQTELFLAPERHLTLVEASLDELTSAKWRGLKTSVREQTT